MTVSGGLLELVERFDRNREAYRSGQYNETQVRVEFIDPLMALLGWDIYNRQGHPEAYREVVHEDRVKIGGGTKAPDYGFYTGGARKFFLEAKKPSVDIRGDVNPGVQLRRYAWSARLPLSILTDFEEFAIYDCRYEPAKTDKPSTARLDFVTYDQYPDRWEDIYSLFSRDAVIEGSLDKYAESTRRKRGTETINAAFLREIESWRDALARDIASRNPGLNGRQLNHAVQMTIDRIIFLRMAEDRGIEDYGRLLGLVNGNGNYGRLLELFRQADDRYNSGLFHFRRERGRDEEPDELTPSLEIDDRVLEEIIRGLYYPESPYEFSVLPVDVLGQVYEQFLGKVIQLDGRKAVVEEKPEVRKAGGVYYTPTYIVDYIVEHTVGKLLEGKRPGPRGVASKLKIVDPACGSGSFLIGAYQYLLDWHRDRYVEDGPEKWSKQLHQGPGGRWLLTIDEKRRILLNNIHGVDIDPQAVEVTKLSLLLKVLEGESEATLTTQLRMFQERALPDLDNNIKSGNSLIGPDFYEDEQMMLLDEEEHYRINVFDWRAAFPRVFSGGNPGFDAVIGNPPYIRIQALKEFAPVEVEHYKKAYRSAGKGNYDIYVVFVERGLSLLNENGRLGYILPHKFFNLRYGQPIRELLAEGRHLSEIVHFGDEQVFVGATTYTALLFLDKIGQDKFHFVKVNNLTNWRTTGEATYGSLPTAKTHGSEWHFTVGSGSELLERLNDMPIKLAGASEKIFQGLITGSDKVFVLNFRRTDGITTRVYSTALDREFDIEAETLQPLLKGAEIRRYQVAEVPNVILSPYKSTSTGVVLLGEQELSTEYPLAWAYLNEVRPLLEARERGKWRVPQWWQFGRNQNMAEMTRPKILCQVLSTRGNFALDLTGEMHFLGGGTAGGNGVTVPTDDARQLKYLLGILNSRLATYYVSRVGSGFRGNFFAFAKSSLAPLPLPPQAPDQLRYDRMVGLVERMLALHEKLAEARIERERTVIGHQIAGTDRQIDRLVYELYGLTEEEIKIVEEGMDR